MAGALGLGLDARQIEETRPAVLAEGRVVAEAEASGYPDCLADGDLEQASIEEAASAGRTGTDWGSYWDVGFERVDMRFAVAERQYSGAAR